MLTLALQFYTHSKITLQKLQNKLSSKFTAEIPKQFQKWVFHKSIHLKKKILVFIRKKFYNVKYTMK